MKPNDKVVIMPANKAGEVKSIEMHHEQLTQAVPGDNVGFNLRGIDKKDIKRGDVLGPASNPPSVAKSFTAQIVVLNHPSVLTVGYTPVFHCHTAQVACTFEEIQKLIDPKTGQGVVDREGQVKDGVVQYLKTGDVGIVKIRPTKPLCIERQKDFPQLGRFAIRDMGQTVAAGVCIEIEKKTE
jgi:elongation factor 1-alpha